MYRNDHISSNSVIATQHGANFGNANAASAATCRHRYPIWGVQHRTACDAPMAYNPIGQTMHGVRPMMRARMATHGSGPIFPRDGSLTAMQITEPRVVSQGGRSWHPVPQGTPVRTVPPSPAPGRNDVVLNVVPGLGESTSVANRGYLLGANEIFTNVSLQVPMARLQQPFTSPTEGVALTEAF